VGPFKKVLILVQRPQHKSISDPVGAPKNNPFGAIFIEFGYTKKCCSYSWLEPLGMPQNGVFSLRIAHIAHSL